MHAYIHTYTYILCSYSHSLKLKLVCTNALTGLVSKACIVWCEYHNPLLAPIFRLAPVFLVERGVKVLFGASIIILFWHRYFLCCQFFFRREE